MFSVLPHAAQYDKFEDSSDKLQHRPFYKNFCLLAVLLLAFIVGLSLGVVLPLVLHEADNIPSTKNLTSQAIKSVFVQNSFRYKTSPSSEGVFPTVSFVERKLRVNQEDSSTRQYLVRDNIYWGELIERSLPTGYTNRHFDSWTEYVSRVAAAVKLEPGCGRMQNRLVTFRDGTQGCVRYRQNTDQIQGELFSFYLAQILKLSNLAPSTLNIVDPGSTLWRNLGADIAAAQWYPNRPIIITKYLANLDSSGIPDVFKPVDRHLNRLDVFNITGDVFPIGTVVLQRLVELAQWSDLIVFDYLTANLDRIVNNLYNYQWNVNIMDAPAHNLAKKTDNNLLVFLDNESGLLHGYRLLKKYEVYHSLLLDNLCMFRQSTISVIKRLKRDGNIGFLLREMFEKYNSDSVKRILPTIPDNSVKILNDRIDKVYNQVLKCQAMFEGGANRIEQSLS